MSNKPKTSHIFIDMDGVLADFVSSAQRILNIPVTGTVPSWGFKEWHESLSTLSDGDVWKVISSAGVGFWEDLPRLPWAAALVDVCRSMSDNVRICTSCPRDERVMGAKRRWLGKYFPFFDHPARFIPIKDKWLLTGGSRCRILIDDSLDNINKWHQARGTAVVFPQEWNHWGEFNKRNQYLNWEHKKLCSFVEEIRLGG